MKGGWGLGWRQRFFSSLPSSDHVLSQEGEYLLLFATVPAQTIIKFIAQTNQCAQSVNPCKSIHMCAISESTQINPHRAYVQSVNPRIPNHVYVYCQTSQIISVPAQTYYIRARPIIQPSASAPSVDTNSFTGLLPTSALSSLEWIKQAYGRY